MSEYVHIVCLDCPAPADYGGAIDMYYKIIALHQIGKKIILHYFNYRPDRNVKELVPYCEQIYSYKRKSFIQSFLFSRPYIVSSRINKKLIKRLNEDEHPVILEGIHCTGILPYLKSSKKIVIRLHNDEAVYYENLAKTEDSFWKRFYFNRESQLLKKYQHRINKHHTIACLSATDATVFKEEYGFTKAQFIPCFIPWQSLNSRPGKGEFFLYHGNMAVKENEAAAIWLIRNVFQKLNLPFMIAGKGISKKLRVSVTNPHIKLVTDPTMEDLEVLIRSAHANVLPSMNATGVKLKLLHALFEGRFCFSNHAGVAGSTMEQIVSISESPATWCEKIMDCVTKELTEEEIEKRKKILHIYNNNENARKISGLL